jgi:hypothetical protein
VQVAGAGKNVQGFCETLNTLEMMKLPSSQESFDFTSGASDSTLLLVRSKLPHDFNFFFDPHKEMLKEKDESSTISLSKIFGVQSSFHRVFWPIIITLRSLLSSVMSTLLKWSFHESSRHIHEKAR